MRILGNLEVFYLGSSDFKPFIRLIPPIVEYSNKALLLSPPSDTRTCSPIHPSASAGYLHWLYPRIPRPSPAKYRPRPSNFCQASSQKVASHTFPPPSCAQGYPLQTVASLD